MVVVGVLYACMCASLYVHTQRSGVEVGCLPRQTPLLFLKMFSLSLTPAVWLEWLASKWQRSSFLQFCCKNYHCDQLFLWILSIQTQAPMLSQQSVVYTEPSSSAPIKFPNP